jgi:hypothetical protein
MSFIKFIGWHMKNNLSDGTDVERYFIVVGIKFVS